MTGLGVASSTSVGRSRAGLFSNRPPHKRCKGGLVVTAATKRVAEKHVVCVKKVEAKAEHVEQVKRACAQLQKWSQQQQQDRSSGVIAFDVMQDAWEPNVFHFWERYSNNDAMGQHNTATQYMSFLTEIQPHLESPVGIALYEWKDGALGHACVTGGPKGEGGLDDATGASGAAAGASMKQSSATVDLGKVRRGDEGDSFGMDQKFPWLQNLKEAFGMGG